MNKRGNLLIVTGIGFLICALCLVGFNTYQDWKAGNTTKMVQEQLVHTIENAEIYPVVEEAEMPGISIDDHRYIGILEFPSLQLTLPVMDECTSDNLNNAPCRYYGSPYSGNFIIAGHNYQSHFGRLDQLKAGDEVMFTDADGNKYTYEVISMETIAGNDRKRMLEETYDMTLLTCTFSGRNRIAIRCMSTK